jgi:hypothetical protein
VTLQKIEPLAVAGFEAMSDSVGDDQPNTNAHRECESVASLNGSWVAITHNQSTGDGGAEPIAEGEREHDRKQHRE